MFRRKSIATSAAGLLSVAALAAGCTSAPLTDVHKILSNAVTAMSAVNVVNAGTSLATTSPGNLQSVQFTLDAGGQLLFGIEAAPTAEPSATPTASASDTATPAASASPSAMPSTAASGSPAASPSATPTPTPTPTPTATPTPTPTPSPEPSASESPTPTPSPVFTSIPISLDQAHAEGDVDLVNMTAHITGWVPGLNLSGELIVVDPYAYTRGYGATKYSQITDSTLPLNPVLPSGPAYYVQQIVAIAADPRLSPVLVGTEQEPGGAAYHVRVDLMPDVVNDKLGASGHSFGIGTLDLWILHDGFYVERMEFRTSDPSAGAVAIRLVLSNFNNVSPIDAPPDSQIDTGESPSPGS
ncbi:MAG: hypothetical protein ABSE70_06775 [Candidatus Limnocylindrales bacterium]